MRKTLLTAAVSVLLATSAGKPLLAQGPIATPFPPAYPSGPSYDTFVATLSGLGLLLDPDGDGTQNDRCDGNGEAEIEIVLATLKVAAVVADTACNASTEGIHVAFCIAAGVANEAVVAAEISQSQCALQDALVDAAEIEAAFENTVSLIDAANALHTRLETHDAEIKARLDGIEGKVDTALVYLLDSIRLLHTPEGQRSTQSPACNGGPCTFPNR